MSHCVYPCPCSYAGDPEKECSCSPGMVSKYQNRISGPILDRIDIHLQVPRVPIAKLASLSNGESSTVIRVCVEGRGPTTVFKLTRIITDLADEECMYVLCLAEVPQYPPRLMI